MILLVDNEDGKCENAASNDKQQSADTQTDLSLLCFMMNGYTFKDNSHRNCFSPFKVLKRVYSYRNEFAPFGSKFFPLKIDSFSKRAKCAEKQTGSYKKLYPLFRRA